MINSYHLVTPNLLNLYSSAGPMKISIFRWRNITSVRREIGDTFYPYTAQPIPDEFLEMINTTLNSIRDSDLRNNQQQRKQLDLIFNILGSL